jgi:predicted Zn-dependent peptidase
MSFSGKVSVQRFKLDNGLEVVLHRDNSLPLVAINLWYHVGSKNERPGLTGLAHLFEHMLFQGSQHVDTNDHFRWVQQAGGVANGSTWFDRTNYYETLPCNCLDLGLWLESDRMGFLLPAMDLEKLENQRSVVINERRQTVDNQPYGRAFERIHELLYPDDHPYHWPVIGYLEDIQAATLEDVTSFFETYYAPNNAVLTVAGDLSIDETIKKIGHWFGDIPSGVDVPVVEALTPTNENIPSREVMPDRVELSRVYLAYSIPSYGLPEWYAGDLLSAALSGGKSSLLHEDLVYARPDIDPGDLEAAIQAHIAQVADKGVSPSTLTKSSNKVVTSFCDELQKLDQLADLLSMFTTYFDNPELMEQEVETYSSLESADLSEFASAYLETDSCVSLVVVPEAESKG